MATTTRKNNSNSPAMAPFKKQETNTMWRTKLLAASLAIACAWTASPLAHAQGDYPNKPITIYQGYAVGGNADTIARLVSAEMGQELGQPFVVESKSGAGGTIAAATVARAAPDGYTLLLTTAGHSVAGALFEKLSYRSVDDFQMLSTVTYFPFLIVVQNDSPYQSLADLLQATRSGKATPSYGTAGVGTTHHLAGELLVKTSGAEMLHVPYRGDAAATTGLLGGEVDFIIAPPTAVLQHIKAGKLRALATTSAEHWHVMPQIPTVAEQGVPGYDVSSWAGFMAPAGTPPEIVSKLQQAIAHATQKESVQQRLSDIGGKAQASTPEAMKQLVASEVAKWTQLAEEAHLPKQ